ncbi:MAG: LysM peptidoglycan-binding domain-containing protein [Cytophagales bacterium]|nr:MAG: LysM peptidoglycan-binding domain-containing protein [Cytophagales bacterium]
MYLMKTKIASKRIFKQILQFCIWTSLTSTAIFAQDLEMNKDDLKGKPTNMKKKERHEVELADRYYENYEYFLAAKEYEKVYQFDAANHYALFRLAESYRMYFDYDKAENAYKKATEKAYAEIPISKFWYAMMLKLNGKYVEAKTQFKEFLTEFKGNKPEEKAFYNKALLEEEGCELALTEMKKPQRNFLFENLPAPINTANSEYSPTIFEGDSSIILSSAREEATGDKEYGGLGGKFSDNFRFKRTDTAWVKNNAEDNFKIINTKFNEGAGSFTADKKKFYFTRCAEPIKSSGGTEFQCSIFLSKFEDGKWTEPEKLNPNINAPEEWNAQPSVSPKGDTLFFVSKRPGGEGLHDIWYSTCPAANEEWGPATNMGKAINTSGIDMSPSYYSKESTLFFASNGMKGFGGLDIYKAQGKNFSEVSTAGLPFNSNRDDFYFTLGNKKGFLASNRQGGHGNDDIYIFNIEGLEAVIAIIDADSLKKVKSISVEGRLTNDDTKLPAEDVEILLKDKNDVTLKKTTTDEKGNFRYENLPADQDYKITLNDKDRSLTSDVRYVSDNLKIKGSEKEATKTLFDGVFFDFNSFSLRPEAKKTLDELATYYKKNPEIQIELDANTDDVGSEDYNKILSQNRGQEAFAYLITKGVKKSALVVNAFGKGKPLVPNKNDIARQINRRVEFSIIGGSGYKAQTMTYVIEPKTDIYSVAKKFNMSVEELKKLNNLNNDELQAFRPLRVRRIGDESLIAPVTLGMLDDEKLIDENKPKGSGAFDINTALQHGKELNEGEEFYIVEPGNTLFSIAKLNGTTPESIIALNKLKGNQISVGQKLRIRNSDNSTKNNKPAKKATDNKSISDNQYIVKEGDTMYSIAKKFGLTLEELMKINNLDNYSVFESMVLKVKKEK